MQAPVFGSHVPATWQESAGGHEMGFVPVQVPATQANEVSQRFALLLQLVPSATTGLVQVPEVGSQVPAVWHWSVGAHVTGFDPTHAPPWQA